MLLLDVSKCIRSHLVSLCRKSPRQALRTCQVSSCEASSLHCEADIRLLTLHHRHVCLQSQVHSLFLSKSFTLPPSEQPSRCLVSQVATVLRCSGLRIRMPCTQDPRNIFSAFRLHRLRRSLRNWFDGMCFPGA